MKAIILILALVGIILIATGYIKNNLPNHFSYTDDNNLKILSKKWI
jgi:hypothetical protein